MIQLSSIHQQAIEACLASLISDTACDAVMLLDETGELMAAQGASDQHDAVLLGKLVAGTFASSREMARLVRGHDEVQVLFQQGERANTLFMLINQRWILVVIFKASQPLGAIKLHTEQAVAELEKVLNALDRHDSPTMVGAPRPSDTPTRAWPHVGSYAQRLAQLRGQLAEDYVAAGAGALKLLERYTESLAHMYDENIGGMRHAIATLRARSALSPALLTRIEVYAHSAHCLTHAYGLQVTPALAEEVITFVGTLLRQEASTAARMMSSDLRTVLHTSSLAAARDLMLREGLGQLPVLKGGRTLLGLLIKRDIVLAEAQAEQSGTHIDTLCVSDVLPTNSQERVGIVEPDAPYEAVISALRRPGVQALLVTPNGSEGRPVGIITHADLLYRL